MSHMPNYGSVYCDGCFGRGYQRKKIGWYCGKGTHLCIRCIASKSKVAKDIVLAGNYGSIAVRQRMRELS